MEGQRGLIRGTGKGSGVHAPGRGGPSGDPPILERMLRATDAQTDELSYHFKLLRATQGRIGSSFRVYCGGV